jgi:SAM-dependent methyltransferase
MPAVEENSRLWNGGYDWTQRGDEWSDSWGGVPYQWAVTVLPRIQAFVPTGTILEIAPGYGRWTAYLKDLCDRLVIVDLSDECIRHCADRFASAANIEGWVNDGKSLEMVVDGSVDFAVSLDSLVHVEADVIHAYLSQLATKLTRHGVGLLHHSNVGAYPRGVAAERNTHWRGTSMSASIFEAMAREVGLTCISQERLAWGCGGDFLNDCISVFTRPGSRFDRANVVVDNPTFSEREITLARDLSDLYAMPQARSAAHELSLGLTIAGPASGV